MSQSSRRLRREQKTRTEFFAPLLNLFEGRGEPYLYWILGLALAVFFGWISCWVVKEADIFWQVRAGEEILKTYRVQTTETWSHTANGSPWFNFQWLSTVAAYLISRLSSHYEAFASARGLLVGAWVLTLSRLARRSSAKRVGSWAAALLAIPAIYEISYFRLQMRPDLYATNFYALLLLLLASDLAPLWKRSLGLGLLVVWANFHAGTVPLGIFVYSAFVLFANGGDTPLSRRVLWIMGAASSLVATPIGFQIFSVLQDNVLRYSYEATRNPDFQPFTTELLKLESGGWCFRIWLPYCALAFGAYLWLQSTPLRLPMLYRQRAFVWLVGAGLTLLTLNKIRTIHYQVVFLLPILAAAADAIFSFEVNPKIGRALAAFVGVAAFFWLYLVPNAMERAWPRGAYVPDGEIPVRSVDFIRRAHPARNLLNAYDFGGYLVAELPEYPVSVDGRELPFLQAQEALRVAKSDPRLFGERLRALGINTVLELYPQTTYNPSTGFSDSYAALYPRDEWAPVYFDSVSVVLLRRIAENQATIAQNEYHYLWPGLPHSYPSMPSVSDDFRKGWALELERCLAENPRNVYCLLAKSAAALHAKDFTAALQDLARAEEVDPRNSQVFFQYKELYEARGQVELADWARVRFERLTHGFRAAF